MPSLLVHGKITTAHRAHDLTHKYRVSILVKDLHYVPKPVVHVRVGDSVPLEPDEPRPVVQVQDLVVSRLFRQQGGPIPFVVGPARPHRLVQPQPIRIVPERQGAFPFRNTFFKIMPSLTGPNCPRSSGLLSLLSFKLLPYQSPDEVDQ